jgi:hypothetical protein
LVVGVDKQGAEVWFLAKAEIGENGSRLGKLSSGLQVGTEAIAFLPPFFYTEGFSHLQQIPPQVSFFQFRVDRIHKSNTEIFNPRILNRIPQFIQVPVNPLRIFSLGFSEPSRFGGISARNGSD